MVDGDGASNPEWSEGNDFTVLFPTETTSSLRYTVTSEIRNPDPDTLRAAGDQYADTVSKEDYEILTHHELLPSTVAAVKEVVRGETNAYDRVSTLCNWLQGSPFIYTLSPPVYPEGNGIDQFLMRDHTGDCQYFASALALAVRSLGIPSRLVCGYHGGLWNSTDRSFSVRKNMAHAWAEVYFPSYGWVRFDPTPADGYGGGNTMSRVMRFVSTLSTQAELIWVQNVLRFDHTYQTAWLRNIRLRLFGDFSLMTPGDVRPFALGKPTLWAAALPVVLLVGMGLYLIPQYLSRKPLSRARKVSFSTDQRRASRLYEKFRRRLYKQGLSTGATTGELEEALVQQGWQGLEEARRLLRAYNATRFGGRPLEKAEYVRYTKAMGAVLPPK
jgi:transglutaminase-like putative cysteine protease